MTRTKKLTLLGSLLLSGVMLAQIPAPQPMGGATPTGLPAGLVADYKFLDGSGSTVSDASGNSNNGTLGTSAAAPTWLPNGLLFTTAQNVSLPASLNTAKTLVFAVYTQPITSGTQTANTYPMLLTSSGGGTGLNIQYLNQSGVNGNGPANSYSLGVYANNTRSTIGQRLYSGFHVLTYICGTGGGNLDHLYVDSVEDDTYLAQGSTCGVQSTGNMFLGSSLAGSWNTSGFIGTYYRFQAYSGQLTVAQVQAVSNILKNEIGTRGVPVAPVQIVSAKPTMFACCESITSGYQATTNWPTLLQALLVNQPSYNLVPYAIVGISMQSIVGSETNRVAPQCVTNRGPAVALLFSDQNDMSTYGGTMALQWQYMSSEIQLLKMAGCRVFVGTALSRTGTDINAASIDTVDKPAYNQLVRSQAKAMGADGVMDFAANPSLGADAAYSNLTNFNVDGAHLTNTGQNLMASAAANALNYFFGYSQTNPRIVTATAYTMLSGDGYITSNPTGNQTLTLPDCTGQSGVVYTVANIQSAFTVGVLTGSASQLINGIAAATPVSVPSNSSVLFRTVPNASAVSGCHWEK